MEESFVLNPLDIIILLGIGVGMYIGSTRGIFKISTRVIGIVLGIVLGLRFRKMGEAIYLDHLNLNINGQAAAFLGFCTAFVVVYILIHAAFSFISKGLEKTPFGLDKALGALFGGATATFVLSIAFIGLSYVNFPTPENAKGSVAYAPVRSFAYHTLRLVPKVLSEANKHIQRYSPAPYTPPPANNAPGTPTAPSDNSNQKPKSIR